MISTRRSLLARVRDPGDADAWEQFYDLYAPLIYGFASRYGLGHDDAEEVRDQVLEELSRKMASFEYDRDRGRFKSWLSTVTHGRVVDALRRRRSRPQIGEDFSDLADSGATPKEAWDRHWQEEHLRFCLEQARMSVSERDYQAFRMILDEAAEVPQVCAALGMNSNQVYKAKSRILAKVRDLMQRLDA